MHIRDLYLNFNNMTKRVPEHDIAELDNEVKKVIKDVNSEPVRVSSNGHP